MLLKPDCIACIFKMAVSATREIGLDEDRSKEVLQNLLTSRWFSGNPWTVTSPEVIDSVMTELIHATGSEDPFSEVKRRQNAKMMESYSVLQKIVRMAENPLTAAVRLAVHGNAIDVMMDGDLKSIEDTMMQRMAVPMDAASLSRLEEAIHGAKHILYLADNCGEAVCDRVLMETIRERWDGRLTFAVRGRPALNDITRNEAMTLGIDSVAEIVDNGADAYIPGTLLHRCSRSFNELVDQADLIISKGGGNYDTLSEETRRLSGRIFFLLLAKCRPYMNIFGTSFQAPVVAAV